MSNTPLEVMAAIVANGGPVKAWVRDEDSEPWESMEITGADMDGARNHPFYSNITIHSQCSLTDPNTNPKTRPMTAAELALWAHGKPYAWKCGGWIDGKWILLPHFGISDNPSEWRWTDMTAPEWVIGNPTWHEVPEVEE